MAAQLKVKRGSSGNLSSLPVVDGQLLFTTDTKKIYLDNGATRLQVGGGTVTTGSANGTIAVDGIDVAVKGLGARAFDNTSYLPLAGGILSGNLIIAPTTGEGGEIRLSPANDTPDKNGIYLDNYYGLFRIFGQPSADGTSVIGTGTPLCINPYAKSITGGYSFDGNAATATALSSEIADSRLPIRLREYTSGTSANPDTFMSSGFYYAGSAGISNVNDANILTIAHTKNNWCHQLGFKFNGGGVSGNSYDGADVYTRIYNGTNNAWSNWHVLLSSGNYTAYCAPTSHSHGYLTGWADTRNVTTTPNDYNSQLKVVGIKTPTGSGTLDGSNYSTLVGIRGWSDSSGGNSHELAFTGSGSLYRRHGSTTSWGNWIQILDSSNYTAYCAPASHTHNYLPLAGGTITGNLSLSAATSGTSPMNQRISINGVAGSNTVADAPGIGFHTGSVGWATIKCVGSSFYFYDSSCSGYVPIYGSQVHGAVWNDYAEYRSQNETIEPGYITYCDDDGKLKKTTERLQKYEGIVSDTFGFAIGETDDCKTPLAVSGRALVYCDPEEEHFHSGDCVCAGPDGLAYRMTREEIIEFPDRIVGVVSEIPTYETWGTGNVAVNGRIWIKVR